MLYLPTFPDRSLESFKAILADLNVVLLWESTRNEVEYGLQTDQPDKKLWKRSTELLRAEYRVLIQQHYEYFTKKGKKRAFYLSDNEYIKLEHELAKQNVGTVDDNERGLSIPDLADDPLIQDLGNTRKVWPSPGDVGVGREGYRDFVTDL